MTEFNRVLDALRSVLISARSDGEEAYIRVECGICGEIMDTSEILYVPGHGNLHGMEHPTVALFTWAGVRHMQNAHQLWTDIK